MCVNLQSFDSKGEGIVFLSKTSLCFNFWNIYRYTVIQFCQSEIFVSVSVFCLLSLNKTNPMMYSFSLLVCMTYMSLTFSTSREINVFLSKTGKDVGHCRTEASACLTWNYTVSQTKTNDVINMNVGDGNFDVFSSLFGSSLNISGTSQTNLLAGRFSNLSNCDLFSIKNSNCSNSNSRSYLHLHNVIYIDSRKTNNNAIIDIRNDQQKQRNCNQLVEITNVLFNCSNIAVMIGMCPKLD